MERMTEKISADEYQRRLKAGTLETTSKYGNKKVKWGDMTFDSKWEWERYLVLSTLQVEGKIADLKRQVRVMLQPQFIRNGETVRAITYIADFVYKEPDPRGTFAHLLVYEDAKGHETDVFKLKWKMLKWIFRERHYYRFRLTRRRGK